MIEIDGKSHDFDDLLCFDIDGENRLVQLTFLVICFSDWEVLNEFGGVARDADGRGQKEVCIYKVKRRKVPFEGESLVKICDFGTKLGDELLLF